MEHVVVAKKATIACKNFRGKGEGGGDGSIKNMHNAEVTLIQISDVITQNGVMIRKIDDQNDMTPIVRATGPKILVLYN